MIKKSSNKSVLKWINKDSEDNKANKKAVNISLVMRYLHIHIRCSHHFVVLSISLYCAFAVRLNADWYRKYIGTIDLAVHFCVIFRQSTSGGTIKMHFSTIKCNPLSFFPFLSFLWWLNVTFLCVHIMLYFTKRFLKIW